MNIIFPNVEPVYTVSTTVAFPAEVDGEKAMCEISEEALQDHFGATTAAVADLIGAFKSHRATIEDAARRKYAPGLRWLLRSADF